MTGWIPLRTGHLEQHLKAESQFLFQLPDGFPQTGAAVDEDTSKCIQDRILPTAVNIKLYLRETDNLFVIDIVLHMKKSGFMLPQLEIHHKNDFKLLWKTKTCIFSQYLFPSFTRSES